MNAVERCSRKGDADSRGIPTHQKKVKKSRERRYAQGIRGCSPRGEKGRRQKRQNHPPDLMEVTQA